MTPAAVLAAVALVVAPALPLSAQDNSPAPTAPSKFPAPKFLGDPARHGLGIERTMTLLATSTPEKRNTVRVLFYGQSITEQDWWKAVVADLRRRFPHANLIAENRALGGFASQWLVKSAETDLYPFQPDLLIFHVYGAHDDYERIIQRTRERTTADILIQTDHLGAKDAWKEEETDPAKITPKQWNSFMNYKHLPAVAAKYGCGVVEQREIWKRYLADHQLEPQALLKDNVHLNRHGEFLMAEAVKAYLVHRPDPALDPMNTARVKTLRMGLDFRWEAGKVRIPFEGTRVDAIFGKQGAGTLSVKIDGKQPSQIAELYGFTRALSKPGGKWPVLTRLGSEAIPQVEEWTLEARRDAADAKRFTFTLAGSKTGADGEGSSDQRFVSRSKRIVIAPESWGLEFPLVLAGVKPVPDQLTIRWSTVAHFVETAQRPADVAEGIEPAVTLVQGLANGPHELELSTQQATGLMALRIYRPTAK